MELIVDCEEGRRRGCETFCCRLLVRLEADEVWFNERGERKSCVDKDPSDGLCVYLDRASHRCRIWSRRPAVCRAYDCASDPLLEVVLREGFVSLRQLVCSAAARGKRESNER